MAIKNAKKLSPKLRVSKTVFSFFAPEATEVCLVGSFNQWQDKDLFLKKDKTGTWKISIPLTAGRYEYRFIVDGQWANAQDQIECVPNTYGSWNSVLQVQQ